MTTVFYKNKTLIIFFVLFLLFLLFPTQTFAQVAPQPPPLGGEDWCGDFIPCPAVPAGAADIIERIQKYINPVLVFSATVCVAFIIFGGYKYIMSSGDEAEARKSKHVIIYAIIGVIIIGISGIIVNTLVNLPTNPVVPTTF